MKMGSDTSQSGRVKPELNRKNLLPTIITSIITMLAAMTIGQALQEVVLCVVLFNFPMVLRSQGYHSPILKKRKTKHREVDLFTYGHIMSIVRRYEPIQVCLT